jgi:tRNA pseudouridine38-40 synthase
MVRKMAKVLELVGSGDRDLAWVGALLDPRTNRGVAPAPAEGLVMMDVGYPGVNWNIEPYSLRMAKERLDKAWKIDLALAETTGVLARSMEELRG